MSAHVVVFNYVKMIVEADSIEDARDQAAGAMADIAMFYDIDYVDEY